MMSSLQCICRPNSLVTDQFTTFQCFRCGISGHMSCYGYSPSEITRLFCIKCRLQIQEPFYELLEFPLNPIVLPKNQKVHEVFKLNLERYLILKNSDPTILVGIICTKICGDSAMFFYEWASENMTISFNKNILKYQMNSYLILSEMPFLLSNTFEIDYKECLKETSILAVALLRKKEDVRIVAKEIAQMNPITSEEARLKFESLKTNDLEVYNQFPIKDPITFSLIVVPARGVNCLHLSCFDLISFLTFNVQGSKFRWKCPICKKNLPINEILIDTHLHKIIKNISKEYPEEELENLEYICSDEQGIWKPKKNFAEEWEKQNKHANYKKNHSFSKENEESKNEDLQEAPSKIISPLSFEEISKLYEEKALLYTNNFDKIMSDFKEMPELVGIKAEIIFEFITQSNLLDLKLFNNYLTIFEKFNESYEHSSLEQIVEKLYKEIHWRNAISFIAIWGKTLTEILEITYLIIHQNSKNNLLLAMEIFLTLGYINLKAPIACLEIRNFSLYSSFGCLLGKFFKALDCTKEIYGKTFFYFSKFMPHLHFPISISKINYHDYYEKLSDFVLTFMNHMDFQNFIKFFYEIYLPPQDEIIGGDDKRLLMNFLYYFRMILQKKKPMISDIEILNIIYEWDKYHRVNSFLTKENINLAKLNIDKFF